MKTSALLWAAGIAAMLPFAAVAQTDLNKTPSRVLGHPTLNFRSSTPNVVEGRSLFSPWAVAVDTTSTPNAIFVSDTFNNRVLGWRDALTFQNGAKADLVLGQLDEQSTERLGPNGNSSRNLGFTLPGALAIDSKGSLYIVDTGNNRILRFPKPFANNDEVKLPDLVIGQGGYTTGNPNLGGVNEFSVAVGSGNSFAQSGLAFDPQGNLWFTDALNHRVLRYPKTALDAGTNRPAADVVLGQPDFRTNAAPSATGLRLNKAVLSTPSGIGVDNGGRVYVADANSRVLVFTPPFSNGKEAARIVGIGIQPAAGQQFTAFESVLAGPEGIVVLNNRLVVFDTATSRIMRYDPFTEWPAESETLISPPAKEVIGQTDFSGERPNRLLPEPNASTVSRPVGGYAAGNDLYVADTGNNRVMVFPNFSSTATRVLGQLDFNHNSVNITEGRELWTFNGFTGAAGSGVTLADGGGIIVDNYSNPPRLYIADSYNNRILGYRDARRVRPNDPADIVIGQNDLSRTLVNAPFNNPDNRTDSGLFRPTGLAVDTNGDLFVADTGNGRVLRFPNPFEQTIPTGERRRANLVLGQRNFNDWFTDASRVNMAAPFGVALTVERHLVVSDAAHNRVLFFRRPAGGDFTNGMPAERVFGQPDFTTSARATGGNRMFSPRHIALDTDDRLYVADAGNNRVLIFDRVTTAPNDPPAAFPITGLTGVQSVWVSPLTGEIWVAATRQNQAQRFPRFERLTLGIRTDYDIPIQNPLALTQDQFGNLYAVDATNRVGIFYNGLRSQIAGNYAERAIAPGTWAVVRPRTAGAVFTTETRVFNEIPNPVPLPKELADIEVLINDRPVPLYFVSPQQINYLVPYDFPESGTAEVQVVKKSVGQILGASTVPLSRVAPALFVADASEQGQLAAVNQDGTINTPANAAARGSIISLYGTGMGPVENPPAEGDVAKGASRGLEAIRVLIGDSGFVPAENIQYFGLAPGAVSLYQINVKIPDNVAPKADVDVVVEVRSALTNRTGSPERIVRTTIAVKAQ
ncbi:MAG TPA: hypothetical protein VER03_25970 [Bryobacteraceae bacterium]|nr:hypothetical protein [Bryobacteraceae bacterium]